MKSFLRRRGAAAAGEAQEGVGGEGGAQEDKYNSGGALPGDQIEVCPMATALVQDVGNRIARSRGGALFIDWVTGPCARTPSAYWRSRTRSNEPKSTFVVRSTCPTLDSTWTSSCLHAGKMG